MSEKKLPYIIRKKQFRDEILNVPETTFWRLEKNDPNFPDRVQIGPGTFGYFSTEALEYVDSKRVQRETA